MITGVYLRIAAAKQDELRSGIGGASEKRSANDRRRARVPGARVGHLRGRARPRSRRGSPVTGLDDAVSAAPARRRPVRDQRGDRDRLRDPFLAGGEEWRPGPPGIVVIPVDPALGIEWPLPVDPADPSSMSAKDANAPLFADF